MKNKEKNINVEYGGQMAFPFPPVHPYPYEKEIRFDKNIAHSIFGFNAQYKGDGNILKSLIMFFYSELQNNIFGMFFLDVRRFAKMMNYSVGYLNKKHPRPAQIEYFKNEKKYTDEKIKEHKRLAKEDPAFKIWDTVIENALWILTNKLMEMSYGIKYNNKDGSSVYSSSSGSIKYLSRIEVILVSGGKKGGRDRKLYLYELTKEVIEGTFATYAGANAELYPKFRDKNVDNMYLYLVDQLNNQYRDEIQSNKKINSATGIIEKEIKLYYSTLCTVNCRTDVAGNDSLRRKNKFNIKKLVEELREELKIEIPFIETWDGYNLDIKFQMPISIFNNMEKKLAKRDRVFKERCYIELYHYAFKDRYTSNYNNGTMIGKVYHFLEWIKSQDEKEQLFKSEAIKKAYLNVYKKADITEAKINRTLRSIEEELGKEIFINNINSNLKKQIDI